MAGRADLFVDLEAALQGGFVVGAEDPVERPLLMQQRRRLLGLDAPRCKQQRGEHEGRGGRHPQFDKPTPCQDFPIGAAVTPLSLASPRTAAAMLVGSGRVRSILPSSGNKIQKCT